MEYGLEYVREGGGKPVTSPFDSLPALTDTFSLLPRLLLLQKLASERDLRLPRLLQLFRGNGFDIGRTRGTASLLLRPHRSASSAVMRSLLPSPQRDKDASIGSKRALRVHPGVIFMSEDEKGTKFCPANRAGGEGGGGGILLEGAGELTHHS